MTDPESIAHGAIQGKNLVVRVEIGQVREGSVAYRLRDEIIALVAQTKPVNIVIDLSKVSFVGSVGFLAFLGVKRNLGEGRVVLSSMSQPIHDMFAACRLIPTKSSSTAPFEVAATGEEALARLTETP